MVGFSQQYFILLRSPQIWPVSRESFPFWTTLWIIFTTSLYRCWVLRSDKTREARQTVLVKRKIDKMNLLQNLVFLEEARLVRSKGKKEGASFVEELSSDEPPTAQSVFDVVLEEVEEESVASAVGIDENNPWYLRAMTLLKHRVQTELEEATAKTQNAQSLVIERNEQQLLDGYQDGDKLAMVLEFTKEKARKHFKNHTLLPHAAIGGVIDGISVAEFDGTYLNASTTNKLYIVDPSSIEAAEKVLAQAQGVKKLAIHYIFDIMKPTLPVYLVSIFLLVLGRAFEAPLWATYLPAIKSSVAMINPDAKEGEFGYGPAVLEQAMGYVFLFVVAFAFSRPIDLLADQLGSTAERDFGGALRHAVMTAIMRQDTQFFDQNSSSVLQQRLNRDTDELVDNLLKVPRQLAMFVFRVCQRILTLYFVSPDIMRACLSFNVPLFSAVVLLTSSRLRKLNGQRDRGAELSTAETLETLQNVKTVRQFSMERREVDKYRIGTLSRALFENRIRVLEGVLRVLMDVTHMVGEIFVIYSSIKLVVSGGASTQDAIVASTVGMWLQHDMKDLILELPKLFKVLKPLRRVARLLATKPVIESVAGLGVVGDGDCVVGPPGEQQQQQQQKQQPPSVQQDLRIRLRRPASFDGYIQFKDVCFSYPSERQKRVLGGLSFTAEPGQKVAFVGKAGCGKSTSIDLLQRFYDPTSGDITIDGQPIKTYDTQYLRRSCGVVSQENVLFSCSIYENIVYGMEMPPGPESREFMDVCEKAQAWEFINKFPNKQYTYVGEKGVKLSGGQKQRVAIARVMIRQPTFLFLDEATSALDAINEKAVQRALDEMLKRFNGVAIVVAHRLTTICNCDKIVVMGDDGTKVEEGTHVELLKVPIQHDSKGDPVVGPGLYHALWDTQQQVTPAVVAEEEK